MSTSLSPSLSPSTATHPPRSVPNRTRPVRRRRPVLLTAAAAVAAAGLWLTGAVPASAHVHVQADSNAAGASSQLTFTVPTESETAGTTEVAVQLPQDHPFLYVSARPVAGWDVSLNEEKLPAPVEVDGTTLTRAVRTVTWTATEGQQVGPGEYQQFALMVSPLPAAGTSLGFPATQTYSDGKVVRWDQPTPASGQEPEHPAPTLVVGAATTTSEGDSASSTPSVTASTGTATGTGSAAGIGGGSSGTALALGGVGAGLGLVGAVLGGLALARTRRRA